MLIGSVGHQLTEQFISVYLSLSAFLKKKKKINNLKNLIECGSPPMLYKLVLGPAPILHTNVHESLLTTFGFTDIKKLFN